MKNKRFRKTTALFLTMTMLLTMVPIYGEEYEVNTSKFSNGYIEYRVDQDDGRFIIRTDEGSPYLESDDEKKLLFDKDNDPETSFTSFIIDGETYIYGNDYGFLNMAGGFTTIPENDGSVNTSIWEVDDVIVMQTLVLVEDEDHPNIGNVKIRYEILNNSKVEKSIGSRILLDTMLGANDGAAVVLGSTGETITQETVLVEEDIPSYWRCSDDLFAPEVVSYGFTKGWGNTAPDEMIIAHWSNISETKWDYTVDSSLDFTDENNTVGTADSAVALYWDEEPLSAGETRIIETYYGIGDISNYDSNSNYTASLITPSKLAVNGEKDGYEEEKFTVSVEINNSYTDSEILTNVSAKLLTREGGFVLADGETQEKTLAVINEGSIETLSWEIEPVNQDSYVSEAIKVEITSDNNSVAVSDVNYILLPSVQGEAPAIQILSTSPEKVYYEGDKYISIKGNGFLYFSDKSIWNMYLVDEAGTEYEIPSDSIEVVSDQTINITLLDGDIEETMGLGEYDIKIVHDDLEDTVNIPENKRVVFTDDEDYKSRSYGVLYIEKRELNDDYKYYINTIDSKEGLDELKTYLETYETQPEDYETNAETVNKGELKEIVFDIVGDIKMTTDQTTNIDEYKINTNNQSAIINSVLRFEDANEAIEIKKVDDLILISGNGTLQLLNYGEIWWSGFDTYIADGTDYNVDTIKEEDDDFENITIAIFDYLSLATDVASLFIDGFEMELNDIILLDEGASLGGKLKVELPIGTEEESTTTTTSTDTSLTDEEAEMGEALHQMFMTDEEREEEENEKTAEEKKAQRVQNSKIRALLLNDSEIYDEVLELINSEEPTSTKIEQALSLVMSSTELISKLTKILKGTDDEDDDGKGSVGVAIDVKKVIFGKKYGEDFVYDDVKYIGIDGTGNVSVSLPGLDSSSGITAELVINSIDGIYSIDADVDLELAEAHAFITIMRVQDSLDEESTYVLDDLVLSGGYTPGFPIAPPLFINEIGGGVENLYGVITGDDSAPPLNVVVILGLSIVPSFEGDFTLKVSKEGFSLNGEFEIGSLKVIKEAGIEIRWASPVYLALSAQISAFEIIEGSLSIYIGEVETGDEGEPYEFYMEGNAKVEIGVPNKIPIAGGLKFAGIELGVSTKKMWGKLKVGFIPIAMTWVYEDGFSFGNATDLDYLCEYAALTHVEIPTKGLAKYDVTTEEGEMNLIFGSNIDVIGSSNYQYASMGDFDYNQTVLASSDDTTHNFTFSDLEMGLIEVSFDGAVPELVLRDPNGDMYTLISIEDDSTNGNYIVQTIEAEDSETGNTENYVYIAIKGPMDGTWVLESNQSIDTTLMEVNMPPEFTDLNMTENADDTLTITWDGNYVEDSLVSLFLLNKNDSEGAGYALEANLDGTTGLEGVTVAIPEGMEEGDYVVRATIQNALYGYESRLTEQYITIVDLDKPGQVENLTAELYGNGFMKTTWDEINEEGEISYFATVYDADGNAVEGYTDIEIFENTVVFGGTYKNSNTGETVSLETGQSYRVGITVKKVLDESDDIASIHLGEEAISNSLLLRTSTPPEIDIVYENDPIQVASKNYFNSNEVNLKFLTDQSDVDTTVYLDGDYFISFNGTSYQLYFDLVDGEHTIEFKSENKYQDRASKTLLLNVDTTAPELNVDSPLPGFISDDLSVTVKGMAESGSLIKINGINVDLGADDLFETTYAIAANKLKDTILIEATDLVGNTTTYSTEVINGLVGEFEEIKIQTVPEKILSGEEMSFTIVGVDDQFQEIEIDPSDITWSLIEGNALAEISEDGVFTANEAGDIVLKASYYISKSYSYEDAIEFTILDNIDYVYISPYMTQIQAGESVNLSLYEVSKYSEDYVDNSLVDWEIVKGTTYGTIDAYGYLEAISPGELTVSGSYTDCFGNEHVLKSVIEVTAEPVEIEYDVDNIIANIWISLVQSEKNITIETIATIKEGMARYLSIRGIADIEVPMNTVSGTDELFVGTLDNPESLISADEFIAYSDIIELQLKEAEGKLNNPIKVTFKYTASNALDTSHIGVYYYNENFEKWQYIGGTVDSENGTVEVELSHLSKYAVLEVNADSEFVDIDNRWSEKYIKSISSIAVINGELEGETKYFRPTRELTRLEFAAIVVRAFEALYEEVPQTAIFDETTFSDYATAQEWGKEYIQKAYEYGLIKGVEEQGVYRFMPEENITRAEVITVLGRILEMNAGLSQTENDFVDKGQIPTWASDYVDLLADVGLLTGYADGTIRPNEDISREEIAKLCYDWIEYRDMEIKQE
jgi:hypothetical protein